MGWPFVSSELAFVCLHFSHWIDMTFLLCFHMKLKSELALLLS